MTGRLNDIIVRSAFIAVSNACYTIITCILFLFILLVTLAGSLCTLLSNRIDNLNQMPLSNLMAIIQNELNNWKRHHWIVCQFVDHTNNCFSLIVLLEVTHSFISFTMKIYNVISQPNVYLNFSSQFGYAFWAWFIVSFAEFCLVIYVSYYLKKRVCIADMLTVLYIYVYNNILLQSSHVFWLTTCSIWPANVQLGNGKQRAW